MQFPLVNYHDFVVSAPVLPSFYWDIYSQEERIKKICEKIWKMIQYFKAITEAINDLDTRVTLTEQEIVILKQKVALLEQYYSELHEWLNAIDARVENIELTIANLESIVQNLITEYVGSEDFRILLESLMEVKQDKVPTAVENTLAVWGSAGNTKESPFHLISVANILADIDPLKPGYFYCTNGSFEISIDSIPYTTGLIINYFEDKLKAAVIQSGVFKSVMEEYSVELRRSYDIATLTYSAWYAVSHVFLESTEELAPALSTSKPNAIVYVPEVV